MRMGKNEYLEQVMTAQAEVEHSLKKRAAIQSSGGSSRQPASTPVPSSHNYRITGFWRFKNVIVPPNMYVVHTRRGYTEPVNVGLGISFRYDPLRDSFLVVSSAMQTIVVNANCICKERQGILVQSYVQWIIEDFSEAYQRLDFSDPVDPMSIVNIQLREQAEAVIKDTVSMMNIDDILSDKTPIIKELTMRLRELADGLGLKIITVQIKEAIVSSTTLWNNLQKPFRAEREKDARLAELEHQDIVNKRENETEKQTALLYIQKEEELAERRTVAEAAGFDQKHNENVRRARLESEMLEETTAFELEKIKAAKELKKAKIQSQLEQQALQFEAKCQEESRELQLLQTRRTIENELSSERIQERLIETLPEVVRNLPKPTELKTISLGSTQLDGVLGSLTNMVAKLTDT